MKKLSISLSAGIFLTFLGYVILVTQSTSELANLFSALHSVLVVIFLSLYIKGISKQRRLFYICILLYIVSWATGNIILMLHNSLFTNGFIFFAGFGFYEMASIFMVIAFIYDLFSHTPKPQKKQLFLDLLAVTLASYFLFKAIIDINFHELYEASQFYNFYIVSIFSDILMLFTGVLTIPWFYKNYKNKVVIIDLLGMLMFIFVSLTGKFMSFDYIGILYMITPMLFSLSIFFESKHAIDESTENLQNISYSRSTIITITFFLMVGTDIFLYNLGVISANNSLVISHCMVVYLAISINYQNYLKSKDAISQHRKIEKELEQKVSERTAELMENHNIVLTIINKDLLTGTGSRRFLLETLASYDNPNKNFNSLVIIVDILKFKNINYMMNHDTGDKVLMYIADKLKNMFSEDSIYRTDSNEFAILIKENTMSSSDIQSLGTHIINTLQKEMIFYEIRIKIEVAIGYDIFSEKHTCHAELLSNAEYACKVAKNNEIKYQFYNKEIYASLTREVNIETLLKTISYDQEFCMNFQPQFTTDGKTLVGMEALVRWNNPQLGSVSPGEFIPIAERSDIIIGIIKWTFTKCISQIKLWNEKYNLDLKMSINVSPKYISTYYFMENIQREIEENNIKYSWIDLELTETSVMGIEESIITIFDKLNDIGVSISIDDFGTGYSSLSYLKHFKVGKLKIAKELIDNIANNESEKMIVKSIIMMSKALNIYVIAEGVETGEQRDILMELSCDQIQGYYYGKPVTALEFEKTYLQKE